MPPSHPYVIRLDEAPPAPPTPGMERRQFHAGDGAWAGWVRTDAGVAGGWHHHGNHDSYIYVLKGEITIDYGPGGRSSVRAAAGEFVFNPAHVVHRETTSPDGAAEVIVVRVGGGHLVVNVDSPEPG